MSAPLPKMPKRPVTLTANVESIVPTVNDLTEPTPRASVPTVKFAELREHLPAKRSWTMTPYLVKRARRAFELQTVFGKEYDSLNDLIVDSVERNLERLAEKYNNGQRIEPDSAPIHSSIAA